MKSNQFIFIAGILFPIMVTAETIANPETEADRQMERIQEMAIPKPPEVGTSLLNGVKAFWNEHTQTLTLDDLAKQPELAEPLLNQALQARNYIAAEQLLPIYRKWDGYDPILLDYAQGAIWRSQGKHKKAITLYRNILVRHPNLVAVRLDLAAMLYEDKQTRNSQHEFDAAKKQGLPEDVLPTIALYENAMGQNKWQFSGSLSYTQDNNINNVSAEREIHLPLICHKKGMVLPTPYPLIEISILKTTIILLFQAMSTVLAIGIIMIMMIKQQRSVLVIKIKVLKLL